MDISVLNYLILKEMDIAFIYEVSSLHMAAYVHCFVSFMCHFGSLYSIIIRQISNISSVCT